jgi:hypothetical protein
MGHFLQNVVRVVVVLPVPITRGALDSLLPTEPGPMMGDAGDVIRGVPAFFEETCTISDVDEH